VFVGSKTVFELKNEANWRQRRLALPDVRGMDQATVVQWRWACMDRFGMGRGCRLMEGWPTGFHMRTVGFLAVVLSGVFWIASPASSAGKWLFKDCRRLLTDC
jgi:hypothetical protein